MIWQDLMLDRWVAASALRDAAAMAFGVPAAAVAIVDDAEQLVSTPPTARIILERVRQQRQFPLQILVVVRDDDLAGRFAGLDGALDVARALAARLDATVLFAEGPLAPSEWVRVRPTGELDIVSLDADETGEVESFFVVAERPFACEPSETGRQARPRKRPAAPALATLPSPVRNVRCALLGRCGIIPLRTSDAVRR